MNKATKVDSGDREPGEREDVAMDDALAQKDRMGFTVDISNLTGANSKVVGEGTSQEVGNPQPLDSGDPFPSGY